MSVFTSGNWLMTAKRRAKEGILQAVGAHQATEDLEFDQRLKNFTTHVNELNKIKEAMDLWIESFDTYCAASLILGESFKNFFAQSPFKNGEEMTSNMSAYANVSAAFDKVMLDINQTVQPAIRETFVNRCLKPTISILSLVPAINEQVQERKTIMLDFDSYRAKIQKEHAAGRDSAHPNVVKKAMKLDDSAKKLYAVQQSIVSSIEEYEAARPIMLGAEFASFIACYYQQSYYSSDLTSKLLPIVPQSSSSLNMMDSYILQHNKQKQAMTLVGDAGLTTRVLSGGYAPPNNSFMSTQFLCELKARNNYTVVDPILTRTEYLGGSYGGYNTGGQYMRPTSATEDEEDIREATAQLVTSPSNQAGGIEGGGGFGSTDTAAGAAAAASAASNGEGAVEGATSAGSHLSVNTPVVDAVVIEGEFTEGTTPASLVSVHGSTSSNNSTPPVLSSAATPRPPPPPKAPRHSPGSPTAATEPHPSHSVSVEVEEHHQVLITSSTVTADSGGFVTALDAAGLSSMVDELESSALLDNSDTGFFTPSVGPRSHAMSNAQPLFLPPTPSMALPSAAFAAAAASISTHHFFPSSDLVDPSSSASDSRPTSGASVISTGGGGGGPPKPPRMPPPPPTPLQATAAAAPPVSHSTNPFDE